MPTDRRLDAPMTEPSFDRCIACDGAGQIEAPCRAVRWYGPTLNRIARPGEPQIATVICFVCDGNGWIPRAAPPTTMEGAIYGRRP